MQGQIEVSDLRVSYGDTEVIKGISLTVAPGAVTAIIGPSGCGKSTLLRCMNRLTDLTSNCSVRGSVTLDGESVFDLDPVLLRRRVGMVFQKPNPFPMSIKENVVYGIKAQGRASKGLLGLTQESLTRAVLWEEVQGRLDESAYGLSVGQQQRLCIARALAVSPEVLLMDEPAASLDPVSTAALEASIGQIKGASTVVIVTHDLHEARRVSDVTVFLSAGQIIESGPTAELFDAPKRQETADYLDGRLTLAGGDDVVPESLAAAP